MGDEKKPKAETWSSSSTPSTWSQMRPSPLMPAFRRGRDSPLRWILPTDARCPPPRTALHPSPGRATPPKLLSSFLASSLFL